MFGSDILEIAIGLIFVYLLLSLICSAASELIEGLFKNRATDLERGIRQLLNDPNGTDLVRKLYDHPLVSGLFKGTYDPGKIKDGAYQRGSTLPSYIPARNFALALMDIVLPAKPATAAVPATASGAAGATISAASSSPSSSNPLQPLRDAISKVQNSKAEQALMTLVDAAGHDVSKARENIEAWYNSSMDRVTGWYKRRAQTIIGVLGFVIAGVMNVDSITVAKSLSTNKTMRESLVAAAQVYATEYVKSQPSQGSRTGAIQDPPESAESQPAQENKTQSSKSPKEFFDENLKEVQKLGLPIGWNEGTDYSPKTWPFRIFGWLLTAFAVSLGAPFWFDLLNKFNVVRSAVKPAEKKPEGSS